MPEISEDDPFYEFFRRFGQVPRPRGAPEREAQSVGSGFIISSDGYLITNAHVVDGADEVSIKLADRREFKAKVVGTDKRTDVALLKIDATNLPKVAIGDPEKLRVGEWVFAIGKPFGLENTITSGIVSAKGRDLPQENLVPLHPDRRGDQPGQLREGRCSTSRARSSASTRSSTPARAASWVSRSRSRSTSR